MRDRRKDVWRESKDDNISSKRVKRDTERAENPKRRRVWLGGWLIGWLGGMRYVGRRYDVGNTM